MAGPRLHGAPAAPGPRRDALAVAGTRGPRRRTPPPRAAGLALARAGDPAGAAAWLAREADGGRAARDGPPHVAVLRRAWEAELGLAVGRASDAARAYEAAAAIAAQARAAAERRGEPTAPWAEVQAYLSERAEIAAWRAAEGDRVPGLASGPARAAAPGTGPGAEPAPDRGRTLGRTDPPDRAAGLRRRTRRGRAPAA
ncbi:MAG: hypothetical protein U1E39_02300 [Planctomycetota bacterium]